MKTISILVPESAVAESVSNPRYAFMAANQFLHAEGLNPAFDVQLVGGSRMVKVHDGCFTVTTDRIYGEVDHSDLIIIPALFGDMNAAVSRNREAIDWIVNQHVRGAEVASLCVGAFLLASTGLLDGKKCSTHWAYYDEFRASFPSVEVVDGAIITEDEGIYSSGGANSYWNLILYFLEKYAGRNIAILASKYFAVDIDRDSQTAFMMFQGQKGHKDEEVKIVQEHIEANHSAKISVADLCSMVALGRRSFERRFKDATRNTVLEYIQRVKVEAAKRSFETTRKNVSEVMFDVGYSDTKSFRTVFKKLTGLTPIEYRNRYAQ